MRIGWPETGVHARAHQVPRRHPTAGAKLFNYLNSIPSSINNQRRLVVSYYDDNHMEILNICVPH